MEKLADYQISCFFAKHAPVTREQCDQEASRIAGGSIVRCPVQGGGSYTVGANGTIIQFRASDSALDMDRLRVVEEAYGDFTPQHTYIGDLSGIHIYKMNDVGRKSMHLARVQLQMDNCRRLRQTVRDFARYFASAWHHTPKSITATDRDFLRKKYLARLESLSQGLPERFRTTLNDLQIRVPSLFFADWPMVPYHIDLLENNIHVDSDTGRITGVCDWKDTEISPFGMSFGGLETMMGTHTRRGWIFHQDHLSLRREFWEAFDQAMGVKRDGRIETARLAGILLHNGFEYDEEENLVPLKENNLNMGYLDAVILGNKGNPSSAEG